MLVANLSLKILMYILLGFLVRRTKVVDGNFTSKLGRFMINVLIPCMILDAFQLEFSAEELKSSGVLLLLGLGFVLLMMLLGHVVYLLGGKTFPGKLFRFSVTFPNYTYLGLPVVEALYGDVGVFYFVMLTFSVRILFYPLAKPMLSQNGDRDDRPLGKKIMDFVTLPAVATVVGALMFVARLRLPDFLATFVGELGGCCSPLGMMLSGMVLGQYSLSCLKRPRLYIVPLVKLLIVPAIALGLALLLRLDGISARSLVVYAALPVASMISIFTVMYSNSAEAELQASSSVLISTLLCAGTIPLWILIMEKTLPAM